MQSLFELINKCIRTIDCHLANVFLKNLEHLSHPIFSNLSILLTVTSPYTNFYIKKYWYGRVLVLEIENNTI